MRRKENDRWTPLPPLPSIDPARRRGAPRRRLHESEPRPEAHAVDLGIGTFFLSGVATGGVVGLVAIRDATSSDATCSCESRRPSDRRPQGGLHLTWVAGRLDTCSETLGNYAAGGGLRLDLCGGADVGATFIASSSGNACAIAALHRHRAERGSAGRGWARAPPSFCAPPRDSASPATRSSIRRERPTSHRWSPSMSRLPSRGVCQASPAPRSWQRPRGSDEGPSAHCHLPPT